METITRFQPLYGKTAAAPTCSRSRWARGSHLCPLVPASIQGDSTPRGAETYAQQWAGAACTPRTLGRAGMWGPSPGDAAAV